MIFAAPWVLLALCRPCRCCGGCCGSRRLRRGSETFPAIRLLLGLHATRGNARAHALVAAAAADGRGDAGDQSALARPVLDAGSTLAGRGPVLLVVDNGWASAGDWPRRMQAANTVLDRAERAGREVALLATAPDGTGCRAAATCRMPVADLRARAGRAASRSPGRRIAPPRRRRCWPGTNPTRRWSIWPTG